MRHRFGSPLQTPATAQQRVETCAGQESFNRSGLALGRQSLASERPLAVPVPSPGYYKSRQTYLDTIETLGRKFADVHHASDLMHDPNINNAALRWLQGQKDADEAFEAVGGIAGWNKFWKGVQQRLITSRRSWQPADGAGASADQRPSSGAGRRRPG
jgi:hypothetical protein